MIADISFRTKSLSSFPQIKKQIEGTTSLSLPGTSLSARGKHSGVHPQNNSDMKIVHPNFKTSDKPVSSPDKLPMDFETFSL